jgi:RND family efflux transporter MFP subunit
MFVAGAILHRLLSPIDCGGSGRQPFLVRAAAVFILGLAACTQIGPPQTADPGSSRIAAVKFGTFLRNLRLHGTVGAVQSYGVLAPRLAGQMASTMVITKIVRNGVRVHKGDILAEFDRQNQIKSVLDRQADYDNYIQQIKKKQADQSSARVADDTDLKGAEVDLQTARVEMRKNEVIASFQAEINKQNLAEAEAKLKQLKDTYALKREAEAADLRILEIQRDRAQKAVAYAQNNIEKMTIKSPLDGLVVLSPMYKGTRMVDPQEGDEVRPGGGIMLVVNPSAMQVSARLNQVDLSQVHLDQTAEVRLDAYPDLVFPGRIDRIGAIGSPSSYSKRIRYFSAVVSIQGSNPKLLPDLTAAVDVQLERLDHVLLIPREAVVMQKDQAMVNVVVNGRLEPRPVKIGPMNESEVVIESGLQEGMTVSLTPRIAVSTGKRLPE